MLSRVVADRIAVRIARDPPPFAPEALAEARAPTGRAGARRRARRLRALLRAGRLRARPGLPPKIREAMTPATKQDRYRARAATLEIVLKALKLQAVEHFGLTPQKAEAEMADLKKRRDAMDKALVNWAWWYLYGTELRKPKSYE